MHRAIIRHSSASFRRFGRAIVVAIVDAVFEEVTRLLQLQELLIAQEYVVLAVDFAFASGPSRARYCAHVDVFAYGLLEVVVHGALLEPFIQIAAQLERQQEQCGIAVARCLVFF